MAGNSPYIPHEVVKQQKIAELAAKLIDYDTTLSNLFVRQGYEQFVGQEGDKLVYRVPGRLPYRRNAFRYDRTKPIIFDVYKEGKTEITWGGQIYSATEVTHEQMDFDIPNWEPVLSAQAQAVAQGVNDDMAGTIEDAAFSVTLGGAEQNIRGAFVEARRILTRFRVPGRRIAIIGTDFESAMLLDKDLTLAQNVGDAAAQNALANAHLGRHAGFDIFVDPTIDPGSAYFAVDSAFVQIAGAPGIPWGAKAGAAISLPSGTTARWVLDYDADYQKDRSIIDTYVGSNAVLDYYLPKSTLETGELPKSYDPSTIKGHFVRAIKVTLDGEDSYPDTKADLVAETGVTSTTSPWVQNKAAAPVEP